MRFFFAAMGLAPVFMTGGSGQRPSEGVRDLQAEPDFAADAEFIERELLVPEDRGAN
jgi:hypothetical protein